MLPKHDRSVKARFRNRRFAARPTRTRQEAELLDGLREAFEPTPHIPETPDRTRERYVWAIENWGNYLEDIGADPAWIKRIDELRWALEDLTKGVLCPVLNPAAVKNSSPQPE
jgi:hypothetical protein